VRGTEPQARRSIGIRIPADGGVLAMCDECNAVWLDKELTDGPHSPEQPDVPNPRDGSSLRRLPAHWASYEEAQRFFWDSALIGSGEALG